jgi:hypothetical protein
MGEMRTKQAVLQRRILVNGVRSVCFIGAPGTSGGRACFSWRANGAAGKPPCSRLAHRWWGEHGSVAATLFPLHGIKRVRPPTGVLILLARPVFRDQRPPAVAAASGNGDRSR